MSKFDPDTEAEFARRTVEAEMRWEREREDRENSDELGYFIENRTYETCKHCRGDGTVVFEVPQPCLTCFGTGLVPHNCARELPNE